MDQTSNYCRKPMLYWRKTTPTRQSATHG